MYVLLIFWKIFIAFSLGPEDIAKQNVYNRDMYFHKDGWCRSTVSNWDCKVRDSSPVKNKIFFARKDLKYVRFLMKLPWKSLAIASYVLFTNIVNCIIVLLPVDRFCCVGLINVGEKQSLNTNKILRNPLFKTSRIKPLNLQFIAFHEVIRQGLYFVREKWYQILLAHWIFLRTEKVSPISIRLI